MAECFDPSGNQCLYSPACALKNVLGSAIDAYLGVLDNVTLASLVKKSRSSPPPVAAVQMHPPEKKKKSGA